jgi:integrase
LRALFFFDLDDGGPRNLESMGRRRRRLAVALGLPEGVTPHSLRKHLGTEGVSAGLDVAEVALPW